MNKNNKLKRNLSILLAFILFAIPLSACGGGDANVEGLSEFVYVPQYTSIPDEVKEMSNAYLFEDTIYFTANTPVHADGTVATEEEVNAMYGKASAEYSTTNVSGDVMSISSTSGTSIPATTTANDITYKTFMFSINKDGTNYQKLAEYVPSETTNDMYSYSDLNKLIVDSQGNIWVAESINKTIFDLPEGFDASKQDPYEYYVSDERLSVIRKLSNTGAELSKLDLNQYVETSAESEEMGRSFYINDMTFDKTGNIYVSDGNNTVYVIGADGTFMFKVSVENWLNSLVTLKDGTVGVSTNSEGGENIIKGIDVTTKTWGKDHKMPTNAWNTSNGGTTYDFCYTDSSSLFGYDIATETPTKILTWLNCDVDGDNVDFSKVLDDGNVFAVSRNYNDDGENDYEIITLTKTKRSEVKQKTTLTLATMWLDWNLKKELLKFNKTNAEYRIEVTDYSEFNKDGDYTAGITKLNNEIISGNVPDLIDVSQLPYRQYEAKGLLEDLYPYIDNDPDLAREDFIASIIKAIETDGKLYQLVSSFSVMSIVGAPSVVGEEMGWTMDEMQAIIDEHAEADYPFGMYMTRDNILGYLCMLNMENYMDWQAGECSFNSNDFKKLLTFAKTFPESMPETEEGEYIDHGTLIQDGRQLFEMYSASDFQNFQYYKAMFGGSVSFKGFPTENKNGNVAQFGGGLAMTTSCKDKDGAWQFMRTLLMEDYQESLDWYYPISQKAFDKALAKAMEQEYTTDENGNKVPVSQGGMSMGNGPTIEFYAITQEEADQIKELINSVEYSSFYDESVMNIISEESAFFFSGEKTVEQTADIIQSRMSIYINEQK